MPLNNVWTYMVLFHLKKLLITLIGSIHPLFFSFESLFSWTTCLCRPNQLQHPLYQHNHPQHLRFLHLLWQREFKYAFFLGRIYFLVLFLKFWLDFLFLFSILKLQCCSYYDCLFFSWFVFSLFFQLCRPQAVPESTPATPPPVSWVSFSITQKRVLYFVC